MHAIRFITLTVLAAFAMTTMAASGDDLAAAKRTIIDYYAAWANSGDPLAPRYRKISGTGSVDDITRRALEALA